MNIPKWTNNSKELKVILSYANLLYSWCIPHPLDQTTVIFIKLTLSSVKIVSIYLQNSRNEVPEWISSNSSLGEIKLSRPICSTSCKTKKSEKFLYWRHIAANVNFMLALLTEYFYNIAALILLVYPKILPIP